MGFYSYNPLLSAGGSLYSRLGGDPGELDLPIPSRPPPRPSITTTAQPEAPTEPKLLIKLQAEQTPQQRVAEITAADESAPLMTKPTEPPKTMIPPPKATSNFFKYLLLFGLGTTIGFLYFRYRSS